MEFRETFRNNKSKIEFFITITLLVLILVTLSNFLNFIERRNGVILNDPVLNLFDPVDLTWLTFGLMYVSLIAAIIFFSKKPQLLLLAFQSYILMIILRMIAMHLVSLNPPEKMIPLNDPLVEFFGTGQLLTKDLFFSGHTATLFLLFLLADLKSLKIFFLISTITLAISVLLQHVHYSIDVLAAPFFAYGSFKLIEKLRQKFSSSLSLKS